MKAHEITGSMLKIIALLTMVIDHVGGVLLESFLYRNPAAFAPDETLRAQLEAVDLVLRGIGRLSFPLFVFLLVEGFFFTSNRKKHLLRLLIFCLISEPFYDMAFSMTNAQVLSGSFWQPGEQNVFFTLAAGFFAMMLIDGIWKQPPDKLQMPLGILFAALLTAGLAAVAQALHFDYGAAGVIVIVLAYFCRLYAKKNLEIPAIVLPLCALGDIEGVALVDWILIRFYHGRKGRSLPRYFFYIFYPAHLFALTLIRLWAGL